MYSWLLFDADNTLFDYTKAEDSALRDTFDTFGFTYHDGILQTYQEINRQIWQQFEEGGITAKELRLERFRLLFEKNGIQSDPREFSSRYLRALSNASDIFPGAVEILKILSTRYNLALVTNGLSEVQYPRLSKSGIQKFFEKVFISDELGAPKPEVVFFETVFREIGNPPKNNVLIIGDSLSTDIRGGIQFGIDTCWFNPHREASNLPITFEINGLEELRELLME